MQPRTEIPRQCIWVEAGVVGYKLCDLDFRCEECPFDAAMRHRTVETGALHIEAAGSPTAMDVVERYFSAFDPLQFPGDRVYLPGHIWLERNEDSSVTAGIDHVAAALVGSLASIVTPQAPASLRQNAPCCWLVHHDGTIAIPSPFESNAVWYNEELVRRPELLAEKPYTDGWILRAFPEGVFPAANQCRTASENVPAVASELQTLKQEITGQIRPRPVIGPSAFDGGTPVRTAFDLLGSAGFAFIMRMFLSSEISRIKKR